MYEHLLVQHYIDEHAQQTPANVAVRNGLDCITYGELDALSNQLAQGLRHCDVIRQDRVVLYMQRSVHCLTAMLGILKADATYVPLDPKTPARRWHAIIEDCQPRVVICDEITIEKINPAELSINGVVIVQIDQQTQPSDGVRFHVISQPERQNSVNHQSDHLNRDDDVAYIMYTSGSTGQPKGVMITHRNVRAYIDWAADYLDLCPQDKILGTAPFHFDMSTFDVYCTIKAGATLCLANDLMTMFPQKLVSFIEEQEVTVWKGVSSLLMYLARADVISEGRMPSLKTILFAGEPLAAKYLIRWMSSHPDKHFINAYGPTEATGISLYHHIEKPPDSARERIPIGKPCKETKVFLLNDDMSMMKNGEVGELCIAGPCLAKGYLNDPQKTSQAFIQPASGKRRFSERYYRTGDLALKRDDGSYEFLSRKDTQVKIMGYRIELGEIEHALLSVNGVDDAAVLVSEAEQSGLPELIAYFESTDSLPPAKVLAEMKNILPGYMLPKRIVKVDKIPRNDRGKVDRGSVVFDHSIAGNGLHVKPK